MFEDWDALNLKLVYWLLRILGVEKTEDVTKWEKIKFAMLCILGEMEKFLLLFGIFSLMNVQKQFLFMFFVLATMRIFAGGSHRKTALGCFVQSFLSFGVMVLAEKNIRIAVPLSWLYTAILMAIVLFAPVTRRINYHRSYRMKFKRRAVAVTCFWIIISKIMDPHYGQMILIVMVYQSVEIMLVKMLNDRKGGERHGKRFYRCG